jgi:hypothetical protein
MMTNATANVLTLADMASSDYQEAYSDLYKGLNGFRPRGHDAATMLRFFQTYDERFEESMEEECREAAARLTYLNHKHGQTFENLTLAERFNERAAHDRFMKNLEAQMIAEAHKAEFNRRGSAAPIIDAWEHGAL